jgi:pimeloyl-ACP methyl ester carboxylesterase
VFVSLHVETVGDPGAPAIVFLHGVAASGWMWWQQLPAFADHHCLNVDLPGHGRSRSLAWVSLADTAARVAALVRDRTRSGTAHVVGLSLGGHVALELLERHRDVVDHAVISGVTAEPWSRRWLLTPQLWLTTTMLRSRRLVAAQARALGLPPHAQVAFADNVRLMDPATYRRIGAEVAGYRVPPSLAAVDRPTLVLAGGKESDSIRRAVRVVPALMPAAAGRVVPGVGHGWNVEAPEEFNATVRGWIEGRGPGPGRG